VQQQQSSSTAVVVGTGTVPSSLSKEASRDYTSDRSMYDLVRGEERKDRLLKGRVGQVVNTGVQRDKRLNAQKSCGSEKRNEKVQQKRILSFINFKVETDSADSVQVISEGFKFGSDFTEVPREVVGTVTADPNRRPLACSYGMIYSFHSKIGFEYPPYQITAVGGGGTIDHILVSAGTSGRGRTQLRSKPPTSGAVVKRTLSAEMKQIEKQASEAIDFSEFGVDDQDTMSMCSASSKELAEEIENH
jgi:hypothetical protein